MDDVTADKYRLASEYVIKMVVEHVAAAHHWTINDTLERISQLDIFERLQNPETTLWTSNPVDLADMVETELQGETIDISRYYP